MLARLAMPRVNAIGWSKPFKMIFLDSFQCAMNRHARNTP